MSHVIPFNRPTFIAREVDYFLSASTSGHFSGAGPFNHKAENLLSEMHEGSKALLTPSCSHALELAARLLKFEPGDEIIVPSFTFVTTVSAFVANGATPVFCDIDKDTLGITSSAVESLIGPRTRAICIVHYAGRPADPAAIKRLAEDYGLALIEDNAHGLGGFEGSKALGTFGAMSTLSFHETKNISCGEGGALIINDSDYFERAEILREKGTNRSKFFRGEVDKYTWIDLGSSWVLSDLLAAVLLAQLERFGDINKQRFRLWSRYWDNLSDWAANSQVVIQPKTAEHTAHMFYMILKSSERRDDMLRHLRNSGVHATSHYQPLHKSPYGRQWLRSNQELPETERVSNCLVRLPLFYSITQEEQNRVIEAVQTF
jgi:dTDP-4-amino-4,6-dideoxygalactose transaminase